MAGITHATVATGVDSGDQVSKNAWNAEHVVPDGALAQAKVAGLVADLAAKQASAAILAALAALDGTAGILRVTGAGTVTRLTDTVAGRALLEAADAAAQRLALGLGTAATTDATAYATAAHNHAQADVTGLVDALTARAPGGAAGTVQYNDAGAFGAAAALTIDASGNPVLATSTPTTPASGKASLYAVSLAGRPMPAVAGPLGAAAPLAPHLGMARRMEWTAVNNSGTPGVYGGTATTTGTATARAIAAGSYFGLSRRLSCLSTAGAGSSAEFRHNQLSYCMGDVAGAGGFTLVARFGIADAAAVANARMFVGFTPGISATANVDPSTLTNIIGVGCDAGETTLSIMHNDGSGTATKVALGASFPCNTQSTDVYELALYCPPNGSTVGYRVRRLNTGDEASGTISTNLPAGSTLLSPHLWRNNGATALAVDIALMSLFVESDT